MNIRFGLIATFLAASMTHAMPSAQVFVGPVHIREITPQFVISEGGISYWLIEYDRELDTAYTARATLRIRGNASSEGIQSLEVKGWAGGETHIDIAGNSGARFGPVKAVKKVNGNGFVPLANLFMAGDLGVGSGDAVSVDYIANVNVQGTVRGGIATLGTGRIDNVEVTGNVEGRIYAQEVRNVNIGGSFGTASAPQELYYGQLLKKISAGSIYGTITSNWTGTASQFTTVNRVETTAGPFVGSLLCKKMIPDGANPAGIVISGGGTPSAGVLNADVTVLNEALTAPISATGGLAAGKTIKIAGSYTSPIEITPAGGLHGQLIINAGNTTGTWTGNLTVGSTTVAGPYYSATNLGEGAVGLVPFHVQGPECYPPANATIATPLPSATLYYTFYGPVKAANAEIVPIVISRTPIYFGENIWTDVTTSFAVTTPGNGSRSVEITAGTGWLEAGYKYKVEPHPTTAITLLCDRLLSGTANTPVVGSGYIFSVVGPVVEGCESGCE